VTGRIDNAERVTSTLEELRLTSSRIIDSVKLNKYGRFRYRIALTEPGYYQLNFDENKSYTLILSPGEKVRINADFESFYTDKSFEGSRNTVRVNELHDSLRSTILVLNSIKKQYRKIDSAEHRDKTKLDSLEKVFNEVKKAHHDYSIRFIFEDFSSLVNIAALYQEYSNEEYVFNSQFDIQFFKLVSDTLNKYFPKVRQVKILRENYQAMISMYQQRKILESVGEIEERALPDLILPDRKGEMVALSSLKGKVVLLTFWSVNQRESIANVVELKKVYKKFRNEEFEVYQVSIDKSLSRWIDALNFEEVPWISVVDTAFPQSTTRFLFSVNELPLNYLINNDQSEILAKNISPVSLDRVLSDLFKK
jgi:hypothetical protein